MRDAFPAGGSLLERYAGVFSCAEINSSFYRPHRVSTYERWSRSVPDAFRFAVKVPRVITHERRLRDCAEPLERFLTETAGLGPKRAVLLVQFPPSFAFDAALAGGFFTLLRSHFDGMVACEPRHASWFADTAGALLAAFRVARVAADPAVVPDAARPGGWEGLQYHRLHGTPVVYRSPYGPEALAALAPRLPLHGPPVWAVFDNTATGAAAADALALQKILQADV
jgi:uncharacterized protein YecE (DUF72 family)